MRSAVWPRPMRQPMWRPPWLAADALHAKGLLFGAAGAAPEVDEDVGPHDIFGGR